jgi:hypothetical protein
MLICYYVFNVTLCILPILYVMYYLNGSSIVIVVMVNV